MADSSTNGLGTARSDSTYAGEFQTFEVVRVEMGVEADGLGRRGQRSQGMEV